LPRISDSIFKQRSDFRLDSEKSGLLRRFAPLRKRFAFVAGNGGFTRLRLLAAPCVRVVQESLALKHRGRRESRVPVAIIQFAPRVIRLVDLVVPLECYLLRARIIPILAIEDKQHAPNH
jgi:hypothetical protein